MTYPFRHKLLTMHGRLFTSSLETWSASIRINPGAVATVSQAQADAAFTVVKNWFSLASNGFPSAHTLQWVKLAPIGVDGKYPPGEDSFTSVNAEAFGGTSGAGNLPAQCTLAVSLMTGATRGPAWTGRFYPPPVAFGPSTDGRVTPGSVATLASGTAGMLSTLNATTDLGLVYVFSDKLGGTARRVTSIRIGTVIDTQRRRRSSLQENYQSAAVT